MTTKCCTKCRIEKSLSEFHNQIKGKFGKKSMCKSCTLQEALMYRLTHKLQINKYKKEYDQLNKEKVSKDRKQYYAKNRERITQLQKEIYKNKLKTDINFKIKHYLRTRLRHALKNNQKSGHLLELLGCSIKFLKMYLEVQFTDGMTWNNYGKWHVDHIRPCASFNLSNPKSQQECFHYTNLQPLWKIDNQSKGDKYEF
jgi:hypothetical protein